MSSDTDPTEMAKKLWSGFAPTEMATASVAPVLVKFAGIRESDRVLDVGCGTGVVALTAARLGARVTGLDLTPALLHHARDNARIMALDVEWTEGNVEALPFEDAQFDCVVSQFGHMFAPHSDLATAEMLRVLRPGGTIAFATWPPDGMVGQFFALLGSYGPPQPPDTTAPASWGEPSVVRARLGDKVRNLAFDRHQMRFQTLSVPHQRLFFERHIGPLERLVKKLQTSAPERLTQLRAELEQLISRFFEDNHLRQDFLLSRAVKG